MNLLNEMSCESEKLIFSLEISPHYNSLTILRLKWQKICKFEKRINKKYLPIKQNLLLPENQLFNDR